MRHTAVHMAEVGATGSLRDWLLAVGTIQIQGGLEIRAAEVRSDLDEHGGYVAGQAGCQGPKLAHVDNHMAAELPIG